MFMNEEAEAEEESKTPDGGAADTSKAQEKSSDRGSEPIKPSTRGWTMFMTEDEGDEAEPVAPAAASSSSTSDASAIATPAVAEPSVPSPGVETQMVDGQLVTREQPVGSMPNVATGSSTAPAGAGAPVQPPKVSGQAPSTRGWTMFLSDDEPGEQTAPSPGAASEAQPTAEEIKDIASNVGVAESPPESEVAPATLPSVAPVEVAPPVEAERGSTSRTEVARTTTPKSRGWTMFMEPAKTAGTPAAAPTSAPTPVPASAPTSMGTSAPTSSPTTTGRPVTQAPGSRPATAKPRPTSAPTNPIATATPVAAPTPSPTEDPGNRQIPKKQRGWTMMMEAPIPAIKKPPALGSTRASPTNESSGEAGSGPGATQDPVESAEPNLGAGKTGARGWSSFGGPATGEDPSEPEERGNQEPVDPAVQSPVSEGTWGDEPFAPGARGKTMIAGSDHPFPVPSALLDQDQQDEDAETKDLPVVSKPASSPKSESVRPPRSSKSWSPTSPPSPPSKGVAPSPTRTGLIVGVVVLALAAIATAVALSFYY